MTALSTPLIELRQVAIATGEDANATLVGPVNWALQPGELWVVTGLPGSGKSQLIETAAGLVPPARGEHFLFGQAAATLSAADLRLARRRIGFVFAESGRLFSPLTVAENVGLPLCYHRGCPLAAVTEEVRALLALTGLAAYGDWLPFRLNRTLRQRAALARALALQPDVLFLDDPLSGLAASQIRWWLQFLSGLTRGVGVATSTPMAVAVATDDLPPWRAVATDFALLQGQRWVPLGGPAEMEASTEPIVRELLAEPSL